MKTEDAIDLTLMSALALAITILAACLAAFPAQIPTLVGFSTCLGTLFISIVMATQIEPRKG